MPERPSGTPAGPPPGRSGPEEDDAAWRAARRRAARGHHPDLGGDTESYLAALHAVDVAYGRASRPGAGADEAARPQEEPVVRVRVSARRAALRRTVRLSVRVTREVRSRIPRGMPGARRYGRL